MIDGIKLICRVNELIEKAERHNNAGAYGVLRIIKEEAEDGKFNCD